MRFLNNPVLWLIISVLVINPLPAQTITQQSADSLYALPQYAAAKKQYEWLLRQQPGNENNWLQLSNCNFSLRLYDEALKSISASLGVNAKQSRGNSAQLYSMLAKIYAVRGDAGKGMSYLEQAVDSGYSRLDEFDNEPDYNILRTSEKFILLRQKAELNAYPCLSNARARDFDFMIGEWDVYNNPATGLATYVGYNKWEKISGGCAILENWTQAGAPHNGKSINYYDPRKKSWEQVWVGSEGIGSIVQRFLQGVYDPAERVMKFEYDFETINGIKQKHRFRFFNIDVSTVRQLKETSGDNGNTWIVNYDFLYKRKK